MWRRLRCTTRWAIRVEHTVSYIARQTVLFVSQCNSKVADWNTTIWMDLMEVSAAVMMRWLLVNKRAQIDDIIREVSFLSGRIDLYAQRRETNDLLITSRASARGFIMAVAKWRTNHRWILQTRNAASPQTWTVLSVDFSLQLCICDSISRIAPNPSVYVFFSVFVCNGARGLNRAYLGSPTVNDNLALYPSALPTSIDILYIHP